MVSLTEIRNHLQPSFTPDQAELIASLRVEMHDQLVTRHDFTELRGVVEQLAKSQQRTEKRVEELSESQHELAEAQNRTGYAIKDLAKQVGRLAVTCDRCSLATGLPQSKGTLKAWRSRCRTAPVASNRPYCM
jgi:hypothetical protein